MPFGLSGAPGAFQAMMNETFQDLLDVSVIIYLDDILIFSQNPKEHELHVKEVLQRLMDMQLFCKGSKCKFHQTTVEYLGIIVSDKGFSLDKLKIQAVQEWPTPTTVKQVQSFLGFANFVRRFVANFSQIARPLHNLVKKEVKWQWTDKEENAFRDLQQAIITAPVIVHADPVKPYFLETDASGAALGSVLSQHQDDGHLHPIGYLSESFKGAEQNYDTHDKELLAIIRSFEHWRIYLEGTTLPITVFTDHRNLEYWKESQTFNRRHARWHLLLAGFHFQIMYRPGKQSTKPDALSRRADHLDIPPADQSMLPESVFANVSLILPEKEIQARIERSLDQDESLSEILEHLQNESSAPASVKRAFKDYEMEAGLLFYQGRILVPNAGDLREDLLRIYHDSPMAGHPGRQRTLELLSRAYYWPGIRADVYLHVDGCETCQRIQLPKAKLIPGQPLEIPSRPWQHVSYDMITDLPKDGQYDCILVIVDSFTKFVVLAPVSKKLKAPKLAEIFLNQVWKQYGLPEKTVSDRGTVFNNKFLRALYKRLGIDPHFSSAYHPQSDGQTERVNPTIEHFLRAYASVNQSDWVKWLPMTEFAYNNATHSATGQSPFTALYGWQPTLTPSNVETNVPEANELANAIKKQWEEVASALRQSKARLIEGQTTEVPLSFEIGEEAWLDAKNINLKTKSDKLTERRLGPFKVVNKISDRAYRLELPETMRIHDVFYVGLLSKVKRNELQAWENRPPPITVDGEEEYEVEGIMDSRETKGKWDAILGIKWLQKESPEIDWSTRQLSLPIASSKLASIAQEEEADDSPLAGIPEQYHVYAKVFGEEEFNKLPPHQHYDIGIELTDNGPLNSPLYSMTDAESITLKEWLEAELKAGKIRPSKSSISSPVMFVPKKDGSCRLVVDYRRLNNQTKKTFTHSLAQMILCQNSAEPRSSPNWICDGVTTMSGHDLWPHQRAGCLQYFMNDLFQDLLDVYMIIYLDDILIFSKNKAKHEFHVHEVLQQLETAQLFCKGSKCEFHCTQVEYLGIIVSDQGFSLDKLKIQAVQEWPVPSTVKQVQSFLGFANFLRRFVAKFSHMARPLHNLVKKETTCNWSEKEQAAFDGLKKAITEPPVLAHADPDKLYFLETDASGAALGSVLSQQQDDGRLHPIGFLSESFKGAEVNYDMHNKELLAIIRSFKHWRIFLEATPEPVTVFTNHRNLEYWKELRTFNRRHACWHLLLADFNFRITYRPGKQSGKPDALSQRSDHADIPPENQSMLPQSVFANIATVLPEKEIQRQIEASLHLDESLDKILAHLQDKSKAPPSVRKGFKDCRRCHAQRWHLKADYTTTRESLTNILTTILRG
ncbi:Retrotransposable element Tf2 155 kDa protein type 1 OS=Schizosaccharomyces pombe (strain 972 / ATCC 24843) GN=Tf2-1 PE=4 SV=1 [Rhizoctonia solani AG-1 IB]|uniref:Retrotransposable element Tf2 155 kDa protein type 1 n=1 Tax=Thanatephorus cucumeris (strain AG1-IB / isolate 7/3/14) TaxID=1108050 RepID=A0A0B7FZB2_THACB|nr:Retrotransposable element Tf2 155 kDa protein type 1 OS=Schizosaccharomyces pombe (strain 972 / ATCC 24843) GN=Tf2-1 PE=4 SV=1 [Rhizoctonia solani AG-1 IB]